MASGPPSDSPITAARSLPTASMTARMSSIRSSSVRRARDAVRHAHAALVEEDQPRELAEPLAVAAELPAAPSRSPGACSALRVDEVDRAVADDAIGDVDVAAAREAHLVTSVPRMERSQVSGGRRSGAAEATPTRCRPSRPAARAGRATRARDEDVAVLPHALVAAAAETSGSARTVARWRS